MSGEGPGPAAGAVNWEAYSHEELYRMLWQDADVADVSVVATEWAQHRVALDTHAGVLREQRVALLDSWHGPAAEEAADRLATLASRVEKISELAHAGQRAAQEAADALARARAMMPPPPAAPADPSAGDRQTGDHSAGDQGAGGQRTITRSAFATAFPHFAPPTAPPTMPLAFPSAPAPLAFPTTPPFPTLSFPAAPALPSTPTSTSSPSSFATMFAPTGNTATSGTGAAFGAVGGAGFSFYFGASTLDQQKADAVRAMQAYESSLVGGGKLIDGARGAIPPASQVTSANGPAAGGVPGGPTTSGRGAGVPWTRLLGGGGSGLAPLAGTGSATGGSAPSTGHGVPLGPGSRVGVLPGAAGAVGMPSGSPAGDPAARGTTQAAMAPPVGGRASGGDDEAHENRMPTIDHGLFTVDEPVSPAVIGQTTGAHA